MRFNSVRWKTTPWLATAAAQVQLGATGAALVLVKSRMGQKAAAPGSCGPRSAGAELGKEVFS